MEQLNSDKDAKRVVKDEAESLEKAALDVIREEEERQKALKEEQEKKDKETEAVEFFNKFDLDKVILNYWKFFDIVLDSRIFPLLGWEIDQGRTHFCS